MLAIGQPASESLLAIQVPRHTTRVSRGNRDIEWLAVSKFQLPGPSISARSSYAFSGFAHQQYLHGESALSSDHEPACPGGHPQRICELGKLRALVIQRRERESTNPAYLSLRLSLMHRSAARSWGRGRGSKGPMADCHTRIWRIVGRRCRATTMTWHGLRSVPFFC